MGTQRFTSVMEAPKFFGSNVRGIFLGGDGVALEVGVGVSVEGTAVGDAECVGSVVGDDVTPVRVHPAARAHRNAPATIDVTMDRCSGMRARIAAERREEPEVVRLLRSERIGVLKIPGWAPVRVDRRRAR
jgi:hypothetical protein